GGEPRQSHHPRGAARRRGVDRARLGGKRQFRPRLPAIHHRHRLDRHVLMAGHFVEVMVWAITYGLVGVAPASVQLIYLAFDNYTTLGYAELVAPEQWRLLRPMTA